MCTHTHPPLMRKTRSIPKSEVSKGGFTEEIEISLKS